MKKIVWVYGPQGSGKTTLLRQVVIQNNLANSIVFDGDCGYVDAVLGEDPGIRNSLVRSAKTGKQIFIVTQDKPLLPDILKENVLLLEAVNH